MTRSSTGPVNPLQAGLFGLFVGIAGAGLVAAGGYWMGFIPTPFTVGAVVLLGLGLAYVAGRGLTLA